MYSRYYKYKNLQVHTAEIVEKLFKKLGLEYYSSYDNAWKIRGIIRDELFHYGEDVIVEWSSDHCRFIVFPDVEYYDSANKSRGFITANLRKNTMYANCIEDIVEIKQNVMKLLREKTVENYNNSILSALSRLE